MSVMAVALVAFGLPLITMSAASAHNPSIKADCTGITVSGTLYDSRYTNTMGITLDGTVSTWTFGSEATHTVLVPQDGLTHPYSAFVHTTQSGRGFNETASGTVGPCAAVPVNPTIHEPTCTTPGQHSVGSFDLPDNDTVNGITYTRSGTNEVLATVTSKTGRFVLPPGSPWTLVTNTNAKQATYTVTYKNPAGYPDCLEQLPVPVAPTASNSDCYKNGDLVVGTTPHVQTKVDNGHGIVKIVTQDTHFGPGDYTLTYTALDGYTFPDGKKTATATATVLQRLAGDQCATPVTPQAPTVNKTCTGPGTGTSSVTLPADKDGIAYTQKQAAGGVLVTATADDTHKFDLVLPSGWTRVSSHVATYAVQFPASYPECIAVPTPPAATDAGCATDGTLTVTPTEHVITTVDDNVLKGETVFGAGEHTISYAPAEGYKFVDEARTSFPIPVPFKLGNCPAAVVSPTVTQSVCTGPGTHSDPVVTLGDVEGDHVSYKYDAATHVVTASADTGYALANLPVGWTMQENGTATYVVTFTDPGPCTVIVSPPTTTSPTVQVKPPHAHHPAVLPNTGGPNQWLALGGLVLLLGGGALLTRERRLRRSEG